MGWMIILFFGLMALTSRRVGRDMIDSIELRLENVALLSQLTAANDGLRKEVEERTRSDEALVESERKYRLLFDNISAGFALHEMIYDERGQAVDYRFLEANPAFETLTGAPIESIRGKSVKELMPDTEQYWIDVYGDVAKTGEPMSYVNYAKEIGKHFETLAFSPEIGKFAVLFTDVTERMRKDEKLKELSSAVEHTTASVVVTDRKGTIEYVNPAFTEVTGYTSEECLGQNPRILKTGHSSPEDYKNLWETILSGETWKGVFLNRKKDGSQYWEQASISPVFDADGAITHFVAVKEDITERKLMSEKLAEAQKFESLGIMAGGIAHSFNNLLSVIIGYSELLEEDFEEGTEQRSNAEAVIDAARRAANLSGKMLTFTGQTSTDRVSVDISAEMVSVADTFRDSLPDGVVFETRYTPALPKVRADSAEIGKACTALLTNALEALGDSGGTISLSTGSAHYSADDTHPIDMVRGSLDEGDYVYIQVADTGCGIDSATLPTIFDPFFSTKFEGRGMGLPVALGIIRVHGGAITVESKPENGAAFRLLLPVTA
jgi:PAS domain S-box-containing protein